MTPAQPSLFPFLRSKRNRFVVAGLAGLCCLTVLADLLFAYWQGTGFFLSESLLFSTFWLLCLPILTVQQKLLPVIGSHWLRILTPIAAACFHLFVYPALIWLLSACFYDHTFRYGQTFYFGLTEHSLKALLIYSIPYPIAYFIKAAVKSVTVEKNKETSESANPLTSIIVADANNNRIPVAVSEILYFSANPPYVNIHHPAKKYLHTGTLKSFESQLLSQGFVRIHKSFLVNLAMVESYHSRQNGDFDLTLTDGTVLRLSRNYAGGFKEAFGARHRVKPI